MTSQIFAGVDEVDRGCLAGPVVSVAIILNDTIDKSLMIDSKKLTQKRRRKEIRLGFLSQRILFFNLNDLRFQPQETNVSILK